MSEEKTLKIIERIIVRILEEGSFLRTGSGHHPYTVKDEKPVLGMTDIEYYLLTIDDEPLYDEEDGEQLTPETNQNGKISN